MKKLLYFIIGIILLIILTAFIKFNFSDSDVYFQDKKGNFINDKGEKIDFIENEKQKEEINLSREKWEKEYKKEYRCGYFENLIPGKWVLVDKDGEWLISLPEEEWLDQESLEKIPNIFNPEYDYVKTTGNQGFACACLSVFTDKTNHKIIKIFSGKNLELDKCLNDKNIKK